MTPPDVTGRTRLCLVVGDPVFQLRTPRALNEIARAHGVDAIVVPLHVDAAGLSSAIEACRSVQNLNGLVVTVPHKIAVAPLCDELSGRAQRVEAVNVIRRMPDGRLLGDMFDGFGFVRGLERARISVAGRSVYLAGAGGAANAIAFALAEAGAARIAVHNRTEERARELTRRLRLSFPELDVHAVGRDLSGYDLVINATSLGLREEEELPVEVATLAPHMVVAEVVMQPPDTRLLKAAAALGCRTHSGRAMLDAQLDLLADYLGLRQPVA